MLGREHSGKGSKKFIGKGGGITLRVRLCLIEMVFLQLPESFVFLVTCDWSLFGVVLFSVFYFFCFTYKAYVICAPVLAEGTGDLATMKEEARIHVLVLFSSSTLKHVEPHSSNSKNPY